MKVALVEATPADESKVFVWHNNPQTRCYSVNPEEVSWEEHKRWFAGVLADRSRHLLIAKDDGDEVGVLRLDVENDAADISIYVIPGLADRGYGTAIIRAAIEWTEANLPVDRLTAKVSEKNTSSVRLFNKIGFVLIVKNNNWLSFEKELRR